MNKFDETRISRFSEYGGMEVMKATFRGHAFPRHFHETFVIEVVEDGADAFFCSGRDYVASKGQIVIINPGEVHTGRPADNRPLKYRSFYPAPQSLKCTDAEMGEMPWFSSNVISDHTAARNLVVAHEALLNESDRFERDSKLTEAFGGLMSSHAGVKPESDAADDKVVERVKVILQDRFSDPPHLKDLAYECGYSSFHLLRLFRKSVGIPPFEYLNVVRIEKAKSMLRRGMRPSEIAILVGYADQAHLTRQFKRLVGVTPGHFRK